jgi:N-acetylmuramoyl-L-alanine amidase
MRKINEIILHCSATPEGKDFKAKDIRIWHKQNGWSDIGYHYIIDLDGTVEKGRDESKIGAHCLNHNTNSIGICYIGGCDKNMQPKDTRTQAQKDALLDLVFLLMQQYKLNINQVHCHNEYANKACPSYTIESFRRDFEKAFNKNND